MDGSDREQRNDALHRRVNKWAARLVPLLLIGIVGYAVWVVVVSLGVDYLLSPPTGPGHHAKRVGAGIAIIVVFFVLGTPMAVCYFRVLYAVATDPGLVPLRPRDAARHRGKSKGRGRRHHRDESNLEKRAHLPASADSSEVSAAPIASSVVVPSTDDRTYLDRAAILDGREVPSPGLEQFYQREVFECDVDGLPRWCSTCQVWKPDRSHHSSEIGRCVYKMDHYCPWAGGMIAEKNFKYFIQFLWYTVLFCAFVLITLAYFLAEVHRDGNNYNVNWIAVTALATLFLLFSFGIGVNSLFFAFVNTTTVDRLAHSSRACNFAVLMPESLPSTAVTDNGTAQRPPPLGPQPAPYDPLGGSRYPFSTITYPLPSLGMSTTVQPRTFAILQTPTGTNPYNLPSKIDNLRTVFGSRFWDWFMPLRPSPCCSHGARGSRRGTDAEKGESSRVGEGRGMYNVGPVLEQLKVNAGLAGSNSYAPGESNHGSHRHSRRKSRKRRSHGTNSEIGHERSASGDGERRHHRHRSRGHRKRSVSGGGSRRGTEHG